MHSPSIYDHIRDILLLPFTMAVLIPVLLYQLEQPNHSPSLWQIALGIIVWISGLALFVYTVALFKWFGKGTLAPWQPTQKLIVTGPYRHCRNPMITGILFILTGLALWLSSVYLLIWAVIFWIVNTLYFIYKEEPDLQKRFGKPYTHYKKHVPRWIPRLTPYEPETHIPVKK